MSSSAKELRDLAAKLREAANTFSEMELSAPLDALSRAAEALNSSFSGSWLGYHSRVYYSGLQPAPAGANFSQEWGLISTRGRLGSRGDWEQFDAATVRNHIYEQAGNPDLKLAKDAAASALKTFQSIKPEVLSILENELADHPDSFLDKLKDDLNKLNPPADPSRLLEAWQPKGQVYTRDTLALGQGTQPPPHLDILAEVRSIRAVFLQCEHAADLCTRAASHLERKSRRNAREDRIGTNVFIGHGRSGEWRKLKDFVQDRLRLPWDEFNRVPVAGKTNIVRLSEMLDAAAVAFIILTAEDEMADGQVQARMNAIHEVGLFQGRLGFEKAIVLLEEGCSEFTNIEGLGQIRFPEGNISAAFEEVRRVLEREGLISAD
jgi:predicted nucleotide-binding protein